MTVFVVISAKSLYFYHSPHTVIALDNYTGDGLNSGEYSSTWLIVQVWLSDLPAAACVCMCAYHCAVHPLSYRYRRRKSVID